MSEKCEVCGSSVNVHRSDDGTGFYTPKEDTEAIKAAKLEVIDAILIKAIPSEEKTELIDYIDELKQEIESEG